MEMRAEAMAGAAGVPDHLALRHVLPGADADRRLVRVARRHPAAMIDARVVAVPLDPPGERNRARRSRVNRRTARNRDVDAGVQPSPAHAERADNGAADRPDEPARRRRRRCVQLHLRELSAYARVLCGQIVGLLDPLLVELSRRRKRALLAAPRAREPMLGDEQLILHLALLLGA